MTKTRKKPDSNTIREIQHLYKTFGNSFDLSRYSHSRKQRAELPYTARDAAGAGTHKKKKK